MNRRALGVLVAAAIAVPGVRAALLFAAGAASLPILWSVAAAGGIAGALAYRRRPSRVALLAPAAVVAVVAIAEVATNRTPPILPAGDRSFRFPEDEPFVHVMLPPEWGIEPEGTYDLPGGRGIVRRFRPQPYDARANPEILVEALRTANSAFEMAKAAFEKSKAAGGVFSEAETARGDVPGRTWRIEKDGLGSFEMEFRLGVWRVRFRYAGRLGRFDSAQGYAQLLPVAEESATSLRFLPESPFQRLDRAWFGR